MSKAELLVLLSGQRETLKSRYAVKSMAIFGSAARDALSAASDVDVLVEFEPGTRIGLRFFSLQDELSKIFHRRVDLNTEGFLSRYFRDDVLAEAETIYDAA